MAFKPACLFEREPGGLAVCGYQPRSTQFYAAEVTDHHNNHIGELQGVYLPEDGFSGSAGRLAVVVAHKLRAVGTKHVRPAHMAGVEVFFLHFGHHSLCLRRRFDMSGEGQKFAHLLLEDGFGGRGYGVIGIGHV